MVFKKNGHLHIEAYLDSGYAEDRGDRKSTLGYYTYVGGNLVIWPVKSKILSLDPVLNLSIDLWLRLLVR